MRPRQVSVVLPIYGTFDERRLLATITSIKAQKEVDVEIIVSEQGPQTKFPKGIEGVRHIFVKHEPLPDLSDYNPGLIRNIGIKNSSGEFVYTNDSDIIFVRKTYLRDLILLMNADPKLALYKPTMRRLPLTEFSHFFGLLESEGFQAVIDKLNFDQENIATVTGRKYEFKKIVKIKPTYTKTYTAPMELFKEYREGTQFKGKEPLVFLEDLHCGGNFMRRAQIEAVGGYCENYVNWGCEDSDIQWKISKKFNLQLIPREFGFEVLHLDHPKGYFVREMWARNEQHFVDRQTKNIDEIVLYDLENWRKR